MVPLCGETILVLHLLLDPEIVSGCRGLCAVSQTIAHLLYSLKGSKVAVHVAATGGGAS